MTSPQPIRLPIRRLNDGLKDLRERKLPPVIHEPVKPFVADFCNVD